MCDLNYAKTPQILSCSFGTIPCNISEDFIDTDVYTVSLFRLERDVNCKSYNFVGYNKTSLATKYSYGERHILEVELSTTNYPIEKNYKDSGILVKETFI